MDFETDAESSIDYGTEEIEDNESASPEHGEGQKVLKDVVAYVDVWSANENMSRVFQKELERLGAAVVKRFTNRVTHVIFKEGNHSTMLRAQKCGVHFLSVLWVDSCKQKKEHVPEKEFPACTAKDVNPLFAKRKRNKMMVPVDYEEDLARNAKRVARKQKKLDAINRLKSSNSSFNTPSSSPIAHILVHDTQPRSPDSSYRLTPIRLIIPETPPSMRAKIRQLRMAKEAAALSVSSPAEVDEELQKELDAELRLESMKGLQKALFAGPIALDADPSSASEYSPVFQPLSPNINGGNNTDTGDSSVTEDILKIADNINTTLHRESSQMTERMFGVDTDENLLSSQEIGEITNNTPQKRGKENYKEVVLVSDDKTSEVSKNERTVSKSRRKDSRRLSVQQALEELNTTRNVVNNHEQDMDENPIPDKPQEVHTCEPESTSSTLTSKSLSMGSQILCNETVDSSHEKSKTVRKRKSCGKSLSQDNKDTVKKRRSRASIVPVKNEEENAYVDGGKKVDTASENVEQSQKPKRTVKKKLMTLSDLNDQHSVLVEPTRCSDDTDRAALIDTTITQRGRRKKQTTKSSKKPESEEKSPGTKTNGEVGYAGEEVTTEVNTAKSRKKPTAKGKRSKSSTEESIREQPAESLADDTHVEIETSTPQLAVNTERGDSTQLHSNTTQFNLTNDSSVSISLQETTLSMSMSRAYPDTSMPSIPGNRKSIDEFSVSQRRNQKRQKQMRRFLSSVAESENMSTDSDNSSESRKGRVRGNTSHMDSSAVRKNMRPSLVMTSLHSQEQDVVISVVKKLGGFVIAESVNETTTHVICGESRRTLNILQCLARGAWLLTKAWALKSLEAGSWVGEGEFECCDLFPTCKIARLEREKSSCFYRQTIFMGLGHIYVSGRSAPSRQHLVQLIRLCGGQVTGNKEKAHLYVGSDYHPGMTCLKTTWILDCISEHKLLSMEKFLLDRPKRESSPAY